MSVTQSANSRLFWPSKGRPHKIGPVGLEAPGGWRGEAPCAMRYECRRTGGAIHGARRAALCPPFRRSVLPGGIGYAGTGGIVVGSPATWRQFWGCDAAAVLRDWPRKAQGATSPTPRRRGWAVRCPATPTRLPRAPTDPVEEDGRDHRHRPGEDVRRMGVGPSAGFDFPLGPEGVDPR